MVRWTSTVGMDWLTWDLLKLSKPEVTDAASP
jgi:hypothetical protein